MLRKIENWNKKTIIEKETIQKDIKVGQLRGGNKCKATYCREKGYDLEGNGVSETRDMIYAINLNAMNIDVVNKYLNE